MDAGQLLSTVVWGTS